MVAVVLLLSVGSVAVDKNNVASNESEIKEQYQNAQKEEPGVVAPGFGENPEAAKQEAAPNE